MVKYVPAYRRFPLLGPVIDRIGLSRRSYRRYHPAKIPYVFPGNVLEISTNIGCRVNCSYCPQRIIIDRYHATSDGSPKQMGMDVFEACLRTVPREVDITFSGFSEPCLNPLASEMIQMAHSMGHMIRVYTTLVGMDYERYQSIRSVPFEEFAVHLPDVEGTSDIPLTPEYMRLLEAVVSHPPKGLRFLILGRGLDPTIDGLLSRNGFKVVIVQLTDRVGNLAVDDSRVAKPHLKNGKIECLCRQRNNILLPDGRVYLCFNDFGMRHPLGDLTKDDYDDLFRSPEFRRVERSLIDPDVSSNCRRCIFSVHVRKDR